MHIAKIAQFIHQLGLNSKYGAGIGTTYRTWFEVGTLWSLTNFNHILIVRHLVWKQFVSVPDVKLCGDLLEEEGERILHLTMEMGNTELVVSQSLISSLLLLHQAWTTKQEQTTTQQRHHPLTACYVICNNAHTDMFVQQVWCFAVCVLMVGNCRVWSEVIDIIEAMVLDIALAEHCQLIGSVLNYVSRILTMHWGLWSQRVKIQT